jgi:signal transduction histidine kinase
MPDDLSHNRLFSLGILLFIIAISVGGLASGTHAAATSSSEIRVGSELEFPPYAFVDENGKPAGFSVDLIREVADTMGLSISITTGPWDTVWNSLVDGRLDVLPIVAKLPERTQLVDFSLPHTETYDAFFTRKGEPPIKNIREAEGKQIVVMRSDAAHHALLEKQFKGDLVLVDTIPQGLSLISSGKYDAFLCSKLIGILTIKNHDIKGLTAGPPVPDYSRVFSFAVKKGDAELLEKLNQGLLIIKTNGEYDEIYDKWLSAEDPWRRWEKYFMPGVIVVTSVAVLAGFWLVVLNLQIRKRKQAEEELRQKALLLEAANKELETFSYSASHDLRAPLRTIDGLSGIVLEDYMDKLGEEGKNLLERIRVASRRMGLLIDALLNLSRLSRSEMVMKTVNLSALAQTVVADLKRTQPERDVEFVIAEGLAVQGDENLLYAMLQNLLGNAWKFTAKRKKARIEFGVAEHNGKSSYFVRDNGTGFNMAHSDKLFAPFQRLHHNDEFAGLGIGLSTVQRIIRRHGGDIRAEGEDGNGATFYFTLN